MDEATPCCNYAQLWRRQDAWWVPRSSKPLRVRQTPWRVRFPSASANARTPQGSVGVSVARGLIDNESGVGAVGARLTLLDGPKLIPCCPISVR